MEYLDGEDLASLLVKRGPLPADEAVAFILQACEAIAEAHELGIVHRDIKPANLFLTTGVGGAPCVKVVDFGVAKDRESGLALTTVGAAIGSPLYMAPEQMNGSRDVDARADIWSLGVTLYQLLAKLTPFDSDTLPILCTRVYFHPPTPLAAYRPDVPAGLAAVIMQALEKDRARRWPNVASFAAALAPFAPGRLASYVERVANVQGVEVAPSRPTDVLPPEPKRAAEALPVAPRIPAAVVSVEPERARPRPRVHVWLILAVVLAASVPVVALAILFSRTSREVPPDPTATTSAARFAAPPRRDRKAGGRRVGRLATLISDRDLRGEHVAPRARLALGVRPPEHVVHRLPRVGRRVPVDVGRSRVLYDEAGKLMKAGRFAEACPKLEASQKLDPGIGTTLRLGYCMEKVGRSASAWSAYNDAVGMARKAGDKRAEEAAQQAKRIEPTLSRMVLDVAQENRGGGVEVRRDGKVIDAAAWSTALPVDPGPHIIEAQGPGKQSWRTTISIEAKPGTTTVQVPALQNAPPDATLSPSTASFWSTQRVAGTSVAGAGLVGLVVGAIFGARALSQNGDADAQCRPESRDLCNAKGVALHHDALTSAHLSTAALVIGGAALTAGVVLFATASREKASAASKRFEVYPLVGAGTGGLVLRVSW